MPANATDDAEEVRAGRVVDLRADPQPGERLRAPDRQAQQRLDHQHERGEHAVGPPAPGAAALRRPAIVHRPGPRAAPDEEPAGVRGVVARHPPGYGDLRAGSARCVAGERFADSPSLTSRPWSTLEAVLTVAPQLTEAAARRDLRGQIARLERELARHAGGDLPADRRPSGGSRTAARACSTWPSSSRPATRSPPRVSDVRERAARQRAAQADARARLEAMYADPAAYKGARDLQRGARPARLHGLRGPPAARARRPAHRLVAGHGVLRLSVTPHKSKRRRRPKTTAPPVPPRAAEAQPRRAHRRAPEGAVAPVPARRARGARRDRLPRRRPVHARRRPTGASLIALGLALGALGGLDTSRPRALRRLPLAHARPRRVPRGRGDGRDRSSPVRRCSSSRRCYCWSSVWPSSRCGASGTEPATGRPA